jgi:hypothetical protein
MALENTKAATVVGVAALDLLCVKKWLQGLWGKRW